MTVYVVQYHSNAWGDQESPDDILGVYDSEEKAEKRVKEFEDKGYVWEDDLLCIDEVELNEDYLTMRESYDEESEET